MKRQGLWLGLAATALGLSVWVAQAETLPILKSGSLAEVQNFLFLAQDGSKNLTVLDTRTDRLAGNLELGLAPSRIEVSKAARKLAAIDGATPRIEIIDLAKGGGLDLTLPFTPTLLTQSPDGKRLAVADADKGTVALIDLEQPSIPSRADDLKPLRDLMFSADGNSLFAAGDQLSVLDVAHGLQRSSQPLAVQGFTRASDGRALFARNSGGIAVLNSKTLEIQTRLPGHGGASAIPTATGSYLLLLDAAGRSLTLVHGDSWETGNRFDTAEDASTAYSGWFDSVAVIPSKSGRSLEVIDLWRQNRLKDIDLPAAPLAGAVSADGAKLYLPLEGKAKLAVIDLRNRKLAQTVSLPQPARTAVLADSYGICH
ncbi:MAG TPA: hypothetical protein VM661_05135 [Candidatus Sulfotelmatobacter sp.]|jgi:DNA-binding beta-propeller fold protein YncE|nr:hypothetical protein [Candidatus Sulfotelmatobacter sp.]